MVKKTNKNQKSKVAAKPATEPTVTVPTAKKATEDKELVMTAKMKISSEVTIMNKSQNFICLRDDKKEITVAPKEIKQVPRDLLKELLKNPMVQRIFDKGILSHTLDDTEVSAHEAVAPTKLTDAVERHEDGSNITASVKKFEREGSVKIDL